MKNALILFLLLHSVFAFAQLTFGEHIIADDSILPQGVTHVELADIDGDGDQDMITASADDNKIAWFENRDGLGDFGEQNVISLEVQEAILVRAADLDGDGDMDLAAMTFRDSKLYGFYNDGFGNFTETVLITEDNQFPLLIENFLTVDINMDDKVDLVVLSGIGGLLLYENIDNQGSYDRTVIFDENSSFSVDIKVGDIDNDGDLDIVSNADNMMRLYWHESDNGSFISHEIDPNGTMSRYTLGDIDEDGDLDLLVIPLFSQFADLYWLEFDGEYNNAVSIIDDVGNNQISAINLSDLNLDGHLDLIIVSRYFDNVVWIDNLFENLDQFNIIENTSTFTGVLTLGDINGDGYPDMIQGDVNWYKFIPVENSFSSSNRLQSYTDGAYDVASMDIDEDGDLDVISASNRDGRIGWYENMDGLGEYSQQQNLISDDVQDLTDIHLADLDGDDDLDIVGTIWNQNTLFWIRNEGGMSFSDTFVIDDNLPSANSVDVGDIDGDGKLDIIAVGFGNSFTSSNNQDTKVVWYRSLEDGFSDAINIYEPEDRAAMSKLADIDSDGDLDAVVSLSDDGLVWISNSDGLGSFGETITITGNTTTTISIGDIDNDGDVDIITSSFLGEQTQLFLNEDGFFFQNEIVSEFSSSSLLIKDLDQDGDMDIVATRLSNFYMDVVWYEQDNNDLNFTPHIISQSPVLSGNNVDVADLDNDGDLDVMSASISDDKIAWYENYDPVATNSIEAISFAISPIPVINSLTITSEAQLQQVMIYNIEGKFQLMSRDVNNVNVSSLQAGLYIIQVIDDNGNRSALKFIKE